MNSCDCGVKIAVRGPDPIVAFSLHQAASGDSQLLVSLQTRTLLCSLSASAWVSSPERTLQSRLTIKRTGH